MNKLEPYLSDIWKKQKQKKQKTKKQKQKKRNKHSDYTNSHLICSNVKYTSC